MNIFKGKDRIGDTFSLERLKATDRTFWSVAKEVDNALGDMNHLLNNYLANIIHQINTYTVSEVAEQGLDNHTEFVCLCHDVANGKKIARNKNVYQSPKFHGLYPEVKNYRDKHPEQCDQRNISSVLSNHSSFNTNARVILFLKACESINKFYITVRKYATPSKNPKLTLHFYCSHPC